MADYVGAIDQGTTSTRFMVFDHSGRVKGVAQEEHEQIFPRAGWVEHNPEEIVRRTNEVVEAGLGNAGIGRDDLAAVGITNQRETTVVWERDTGKPVYNAIVWQDTRTDRICAELEGSEGADRFRATCGLPISTYFSGPKILWVFSRAARTAACT
jgi:glycerol kinase